MKKLTLIRHAKSSHGDALLQDFDRPLSGRGLFDAPLTGRHLGADPDFQPDLIVSSPALRALTTAEIIQREAGLSALPLQEESRIYEAPLRSLVNVVRGLPPDKTHVVLFGHNPGLEMLANWLCGQRAIDGLRTGGVIQLALQVDLWTLADAACASLISYTWPAQIGGGKDAYAQHS